MTNHKNGAGRLRLVVDNTRPARRHRRTRRAYDDTGRPCGTAQAPNAPIGSAQPSDLAPAYRQPPITAASDAARGELLDIGSRRGGANNIDRPQLLQAVLDPPERPQGHVDIFNGGGRAKRPNGTGAHATEARDLIDRGVRGLQSSHDPGNGCINRSHAATYLQTSEECKPYLQSLNGSFTTLNAYAVGMEIENPIIRRLRAMVAHHGEMTQSAWAVAAGVSEATVSALITAKPQKGTGKPNRGSFGSLARLCAAANIPFWVMVHPSDALFDYVLQQPKERRGDMPTSAMAVLALIEQSAHSTADWDRALSEFTPDDQRRNRSGDIDAKKKRAG